MWKGNLTTEYYTNAWSMSFPRDPSTFPCLIAQGVADKIVTATSADRIQDVAIHADKRFDDLGITRKVLRELAEAGKPPVLEDVIIKER